MSFAGPFDTICAFFISNLLDSTWRQFRFTIGAPDAEARFKAAVVEAQKTDANARKYPGLYVGSPLM